MATQEPRTVVGRADLARALDDSPTDQATRLYSLLGYAKMEEKKEPERKGSDIPLEGQEPTIPFKELVLDNHPPLSIPFLFPHTYRSLSTSDSSKAPAKQKYDEPPHSVERVVWQDRPVAPPPWPCLRSLHSLEHLLRPVLQPRNRVGGLDIEETVRRLARRNLVIDLPRKRHKGRLGRLNVVLDRSRSLIPLWADQDMVATWLNGMLTAQSGMSMSLEVSILSTQGGDDPFWCWKGEETWPVEPSRDGATWLVLGDLGCLSGRDKHKWISLARQLDPGRAVVLYPGSVSDIPPDLRALWRILPWDAETMVNSLDEVSRLSLVQDLLTLLSPAFCFTPGLLRALRRAALPEADFMVEYMAWNSGTIEAASSVLSTLEEKTAHGLLQRFETKDIPESRRRAALAALRSWRCGGSFARVAEDYWFAELLNLSPGTRLLADSPRDEEDARSYFADLSERAMGQGAPLERGTRAWLSHLGDRAQSAFCQEETFKSAVWAIKSHEPGFTPPSEVHLPRVEGLASVRRISLSQREECLVVEADSASFKGSPLALLPSDNGVIDITELDDGWGEFWGDGGVPVWVDHYGIDAYGRWCQFSYNGLTQRMRWCPPGHFWMGSPENEPGRHEKREGPRTKITFSEGFWLFDTAVTQALYQAVMGVNPSQIKSDHVDLPVEHVSWEDAEAFLGRLNDEIPGLTLSLPSEAQWEYACRAGSVTPYESTVASLDKGWDIAPNEVNYNGRSLSHKWSRKAGAIIASVKGMGFRPNAWGLWHMHGNVWEWCADVWHNGHDGADASGKPRLKSIADEKKRVVRGGSGGVDARYCRSATRLGRGPNARLGINGFRPAGSYSLSSSQPLSSSLSNTVKQPEGPGARKPECHTERIRVSQGREARLQLPKAPFILRTDQAELVFEQKTRDHFPWASAIGRDKYGLWSEFTYRDITQRMRWCPPGQFWIGSPENEVGRRNNEGPSINITFIEGFWLFDTAVPQSLYEAVMEDNPSRFKEEGPFHPVETVSWENANVFLKHLNQEIIGLNLHLPSEAQWEYACRAGSETPFEPIVAMSHEGWGITAKEVNYDGGRPVGKTPAGIFREKTVPVKGTPFRPNAWGLWHMHGNVWEWCADTWSDGYERTDLFGKPRIIKDSNIPGYVARGGAWPSIAGACRAAFRLRGNRYADDRDDGIGFRPAGSYPTSPCLSGADSHLPKGRQRRDKD